jgi:aminoglycoside 6'-N-acetyltransferase I
MKTRAATKRDRSELARMLVALQRELRIDADEPAEAQLRAWAKNGVFVIDRGGGKLGGFINVGTRPYAEGASGSPVPFVEEWFVDRDLRRHGAGRALMAAAEAWALRRGFKELASDTQLFNVKSQRAHRRLGFTVAEKLVSFIKELR